MSSGLQTEQRIHSPRILADETAEPLSLSSRNQRIGSVTEDRWGVYTLPVLKRGKNVDSETTDQYTYLNAWGWIIPDVISMEVSITGTQYGLIKNKYFILGGSKITADVTAAMKLKDAYSLEEKLWPT